MALSGSPSLPANWQEIFKEITADIIFPPRKYERATVAELTRISQKIMAELTDLEELLGPRTERGHELHAERDEVQEEINIRIHRKD